IALRETQQFLSLGAPDCSSFDAWHLKTPYTELRTANCSPLICIYQFAICNVRFLFVRQHPRELGRVDIGDGRRAAQPALPLRRLAAQDVLLERLPAQELAVLRALEALRRAPMCLQLDLVSHRSLTSPPAPPPASARRS